MIATATHGSGSTGSFSSAVLAVKLLLSSGEITEISRARNAHLRSLPQQVRGLASRLRGNGARGKINFTDRGYAEKAYPRYADFARVRSELDPIGMFANEFVRKHFDVTKAPVQPRSNPSVSRATAR